MVVNCLSWLEPKYRKQALVRVVRWTLTIKRSNIIIRKVTVKL